MHVRGALVVKLPPGRCEQLAADGGAQPFRIGNRELTEWVAIGPDREFEWDALADEALAYAKMLNAYACGARRRRGGRSAARCGCRGRRRRAGPVRCR